MTRVYTPDFQAHVMARLQEPEKAFPMYSIRARWSEEKDPKCEYRVYEGDLPLPDGRGWNGIGWDTMFREEKSIEVIVQEARESWWPAYAAKRPKPDDLTITVGVMGRDVWCSGWFSHWTFDIGLDDLSVLASFERYVDRILYSGLSESFIGGMLMGAEDRWRWHGCQTDAPCRCPHCKERGLVRIDH